MTARWSMKMQWTQFSMTTHLQFGVVQNDNHNFRYYYLIHPMNALNRTSYNTISYPTESINRRILTRRYVHSPNSHHNRSTQYRRNLTSERDLISNSINKKIFASLQKSRNLDPRKKSNTSQKQRQSNSSIEKKKQKQKPLKFLPYDQPLAMNMLKGEGYYINNRFNRRNYTKPAQSVDNSRSKRVIPIQFQQQLKEANKNFAKQNLYDWMRFKREEVLSKVSEQIKLKSQLQKFFPF